MMFRNSAKTGRTGIARFFLLLWSDLGTREQVPYVISAVGSYAAEDMEPGQVMSVNGVTVNSLNVHRRSGNTWLSELTVALFPCQ